MMMKFSVNAALLFALAVFISAWTYTAPISIETTAPDIKNLKFGHITVDGVEYEKDVVIENGKVRQRKKGPSKPFRSEYGHTPLTVHENIPWDCDTLVIGIGMSGRLPVTKVFKKEAKSKGIKLILLETPKAVKYFKKNFRPRTNAIFHITC